MSLIETRDFNNKSPFEQLDFVLEQFANNHKFRGGMTDGQVTRELFGELKAGEIFGSITIEVLQQLYDDKYLNREINGLGVYCYSITFKGRFLHQKKGYNQIEKEKKSRSEADEFERILIRKYSKNTLRWTVVASLVGGCYLAFEIWKVVCQHYCHLMWSPLCPLK